MQNKAITPFRSYKVTQLYHSGWR